MCIKLFYLLCVLILTGCSTYKNQFECPAAKGVGCKSISEVNSLIDSGDLEHAINPPQKKHKCTEEKKQIAELLPYNSDSNVVCSNVYRQPEETIRIWIAAYKDTQDAYWEEQYVHRVTRSGRWIKGDMKCVHH